MSGPRWVNGDTQRVEWRAPGRRELERWQEGHRGSQVAITRAGFRQAALGTLTPAATK